jgi:hypothetical protein
MQTISQLKEQFLDKTKNAIAVRSVAKNARESIVRGNHYWSIMGGKEYCRWEIGWGPTESLAWESALREFIFCERTEGPHLYRPSALEKDHADTYKSVLKLLTSTGASLSSIQLHLRVFLAVATNKSYNAAAKELGLSSATAARYHVNKLHVKLKAPLVVRDASQKKKIVVLTGLGLALAEWIWHHPRQVGDAEGVSISINAYTI